jgi:hypothetical protein
MIHDISAGNQSFIGFLLEDMYHNRRHKKTMKEVHKMAKREQARTFHSIRKLLLAVVAAVSLLALFTGSACADRVVPSVGSPLYA